MISSFEGGEEQRKNQTKLGHSRGKRDCRNPLAQAFLRGPEGFSKRAPMGQRLVVLAHGFFYYGRATELVRDV